MARSCRDFSYCYSVTGKEYVRVDHFANAQSLLLWDLPPTNVTHLPHSHLETMPCEEISRNDGNLTRNGKRSLFFGYEVNHIANDQNGTKLHLSQSAASDSSTSAHSLQINAKFVVAADGANSLIRRQWNIPMLGQQALQTH